MLDIQYIRNILHAAQISDYSKQRYAHQPPEVPILTASAAHQLSLAAGLAEISVFSYSATYASARCSRAMMLTVDDDDIAHAIIGQLPTCAASR